MARVTVEDCVVKVPNRFELVLLASQRAKSIASGSPLTVDRDNDKNPVIALREIADGTVGVDNLRDNLISGMQQVVKVNEASEEDEIKEADAELAELNVMPVVDEQQLSGMGAFEITEEV